MGEGEIFGEEDIALDTLRSYSVVPESSSLRKKVPSK